jgi:type VI protein secretion system component Hcp
MKMNIKISSQELVFFTKGDDVAILKVMQYVQNNETTKKLKIVNIKSEGENNDLLIIDLKVLDEPIQRLILSSLNWKVFWPYNR